MGFLLCVVGFLFVLGLENHFHVQMMRLTIYRGNFECSPWTLFLVQWRFLVTVVFIRGGELKFRYLNFEKGTNVFVGFSFCFRRLTPFRFSSMPDCFFFSVCVKSRFSFIFWNNAWDLTIKLGQDGLALNT